MREKLLKQGRYREAAAVFEFGVQQRPEDAEVRNNLGFCLIPVEPREALGHLDLRQIWVMNRVLRMHTTRCAAM